jgi:hypothetical protein
MFCSCTPAMYKPPQQAFSPHISRGYTAQQNSQPVKFEPYPRGCRSYVRAGVRLPLSTVAIGNRHCLPVRVPL